MTLPVEIWGALAIAVVFAFTLMKRDSQILIMGCLLAILIILLALNKHVEYRLTEGPGKAIR